MLKKANKEDYYDTLQASSYSWDNQENNYSYFVKYYLGIILAAYREFEDRTSYLKTKKKPIERIKDVLDILEDTYPEQGTDRYRECGNVAVLR